jgi:hypothetical protein
MWSVKLLVVDKRRLLVEKVAPNKLGAVLNVRQFRTKRIKFHSLGRHLLNGCKLYHVELAFGIRVFGHLPQRVHVHLPSLEIMMHKLFSISHVVVKTYLPLSQLTSKLASCVMHKAAPAST